MEGLTLDLFTSHEMDYIIDSLEHYKALDEEVRLSVLRKVQAVGEMLHAKEALETARELIELDNENLTKAQTRLRALYS